MGDDILTPIHLVPDFDVLYVIDLFDNAYSRDGTWQGQKEDILENLSRGDNRDSWHREIYENLEDVDPMGIFRILGPCENIEEADDGSVWRVEFKYQGKDRSLAHYHHRNFLHEWPDEVNLIDHIMCMGATFPVDYPILEQMLRQRSREGCRFYDEFFVGKTTQKHRLEAQRRTTHDSDLVEVLESPSKHQKLDEKTLEYLVNMR